MPHGTATKFHMSELVLTHAAAGPSGIPSAPLDEAVWQAWLAKGRAAEVRGSAARFTALLWLMAALLLAAAVFQPYLAPYEFAFRLTVAAGAVLAMLEVYAHRRYGFAASFGLVAVVYNPIAPMMVLSGPIERTVAAAAAAPFLALLAARSRRSNDA